MGLINELAEHRQNIESIGMVYPTGNELNIRGEICYYFIPVGFISEEYSKDIKCSDGGVICLSKYVTPATYYTYVNPISLDLMIDKIHLTSDVVEVLKHHLISIYEIDVILGGMLKDMSKSGRNYYSWECEKLQRTDNYNVTITIPNTIAVGKENICLCSAYQPNKIYYITTEE